MEITQSEQKKKNNETSVRTSKTTASVPTFTL